MSYGAEVWKSNELARTFLEGVRGAIPLAQEQIDIMLRLIQAAQLPVRRVLDLGCGDAILAQAIAALYPAAEFVLLDFNDEMLRSAAARFREAPPAVRYIACDYGDPRWTGQVEGPFDVIVSGYSIHHQPDERKRAIYSEILHLLAPGGIFVNVEHVASASKWLESLNDELFIDHLHRWRPEESRDEVANRFYYRPDKAANILAPVDDQCAWLRDIGYQDVDCYLKVFELAVFGGRKPL